MVAGAHVRRWWLRGRRTPLLRLQTTAINSWRGEKQRGDGKQLSVNGEPDGDQEEWIDGWRRYEPWRLSGSFFKSQHVMEKEVDPRMTPVPCGMMHHRQR